LLAFFHFAHTDVNGLACWLFVTYQLWWFVFFLSQNYVNSEICCFMLVQTKVMFVFPNFITQTLGLVSSASPFESNTDVVML